ncbi:NifB/NifX family molybdenum-iron cluster-binding protein [Atrimonas thermophila]|uniref:NifB/NifX family molybdenum-iron cluster-binding protein n=1 Tax=Atrimonas thermophila TaxID=3064161 RepID=UPI00399CDE4F
MKVAIASSDGKTVAQHFGRCEGFVVVEVEGNKVLNREYRDNLFSDHRGAHDGGEGNCSPVDLLKDCDVVVSSGMGPRAYRRLKEQGKKVVITDETEVEKIIGEILTQSE